MCVKYKGVHCSVFTWSLSLSLDYSVVAKSSLTLAVYGLHSYTVHLRKPHIMIQIQASPACDH